MLNMIICHFSKKWETLDPDCNSFRLKRHASKMYLGDWWMSLTWRAHKFSTLRLCLVVPKWWIQNQKTWHVVHSSNPAEVDSALFHTRWRKSDRADGQRWWDGVWEALVAENTVLHQSCSSGGSKTTVSQAATIRVVPPGQQATRS